MSNTENVKLGVCSVIYDGVDLGYTQGGVEVTVATMTREQKVDQFGETPINERITGRTCMAKVPLAETTLQNLVRIMPGAVLTSDGVKASATATFVTAPPVDGDKVTVNGVDFIFKTAPTNSARHIALANAGTIAAAAAALAAKINASTDPKVVGVNAVAAAGVVTISADEEGTDGNLITLAKTFATTGNLTLSGATLTGGTKGTKVGVTVPTAVGTSLLAQAKKLVLHPIDLPADDKSEDFIIAKAATAGALSFNFKHDAERLFPVEFKAYPDYQSGRLFAVGDVD